MLWAGWMWWLWRRLHSAPHSVTFDTKMGQKHVRAAAVAAVAAVTEPRNIRNNNLASNDSALSGRRNNHSAVLNETLSPEMTCHA